MLNILHISDLHFGPPYVSRVGEAVLRIAERLQPDVIVASGDFTQRAKPEEFAGAREFLDRLPQVAKVVVPGNHDIPLYRIFERLSDPYRNYRSFIADELDYVLRLEQAHIVSLNSTAPLRAITNGRLSARQLEYCAAAFAETPQHAARIVVAHHHFAPAPDYERNEFMPNAKRALDRFHKLAVDMILGGHLHRAYIGNSLDVYPGRDRQHGIIIVQCGTTTSRRGRAREREKNSFNWIAVDDHTIQIKHYVHFDDVQTFKPVGHFHFPRWRARFLPDSSQRSRQKCRSVEDSV